MRIFNPDIDRLAALLLPTFLRTRFNYALTRALLQPVSTLLDVFNANRSRNLYNLSHNGQVCYLRALLNDTFDVSLRRIIIDDTMRYDWSWIYPEATDRPMWLAPIAIGTVRIASEQYTNDEGTDFTIIVPSDISRDIIPQMISLVNYYKLAGKRYSIIFTDEQD